MANNSSSMMKHHQEPGVPVRVQQMSYHHQHQHHHHGCGDGGAGGSSSSASPSIQLQPSSSVASYNGQGLVSGVLESSNSATATRFQANLHGVSMDWTPDEQAILDEGLNEYANESSIVRYAKIAVRLRDKTVRDVALRCKWMMKRDLNRRRKDDLSLVRKSKERKEKLTEPSATPSHAVMQPGFLPHAQGVVTNKNGFGISYNAIDPTTKELLKQNIQAFEQISANFSSFQAQNNIALFSQARSNLSQMLKRVHEPPYEMNQMLPLTHIVKVNEDLANSILPQSNLPMQ